VVNVMQADSHLTLADAAVLGTTGACDAGCNAVVAAGTARFTAERCVFEGHRTSAIAVVEDATSVSLTDIVVRDTAGRYGVGTYGRGFEISGGGEAVVTRALFERNREVAVYAGGAGTRLQLADVVVRDTAVRESDGRNGLGFAAESGAQVTIDGALFVRNRVLGLFFTRAGTVGTVTDLIVRETLDDEEVGTAVIGLAVVTGAQLDLSRAAFERTQGTGVGAGGSGAVLRATDLAIRDTQSLETIERTGVGMEVIEGGRVELARAVLAGSHGMGLMVFHEGTSVTGTDVAIRDTQPYACEADTCTGDSAGFGAGSYAGASVDLSRFAVTGSALAGLQLACGEDPDTHGPYAAGGTMDLREGEVSGSPIGVNVQTAGFDAMRLSDRVVYYDNERNFDGESLPVPEAPPLPTGL
jgi:hypothetical protein